jgi:hypothetical protein
LIRLRTAFTRSQLNFAQALIANGMNAATLQLGKTEDSPDRLAELALADDLSPETGL